jgi:DNA-binding NarL/FixJ family response regulator
MVRVLLVDDHPVVRKGLRAILEDQLPGIEVAEAGDGDEALAQLAAPFDVVVLDLAMPRLNGLEATRRIRAAAPRTRVLVLTAQEEDEFVVPLVRAGAHGFLRKECAATDLIAAVRALAAGESYFGPSASRVLAEQLVAGTAADDPFGRLTDREREVFHLAAEGRTSKQIATLLGISAKTAENHRSRVLQKLGLHGIAELVRYAARHGWVR